MPMTSEEFAFALKQKYPQYRELPNDELVRRVVERYPQYRSEIVDLGGGAAEEPGYLRGAETIEATPWYKRDVLPMYPVPGTPKISAETAVEALPAAAATGAALLVTKHPGIAGTAGGVAGEAARQLFRRSVGAPAAPGMTQEAMGLDPNSPEAAAAGLAGEGAAGLSAAAVSKLLRWAKGWATDSAERSVVRDILGGARTEREVEEAPNLAKRAVAEKIVGKMTEKGRLARAKSALEAASANAARETTAARASGTRVEAGPVLDAMQDAIPPSIPGASGPDAIRLSSAPERRATLRALDDELRAVANTGGGLTGTEVPVDVALGEIEALDKILEPMYKRGALDPALGKKAIQTGRKAWNEQLRAAFPELGDARLRKHELLTINEMLQRGVDEQFSGRGRAHELAGVAGAAAVGRYGPAGSSIFASTARALAPLSIPARSLFAKIASGGAASAQAWLRVTDFLRMADDEDSVKQAERNRRAQRALRTSAEGVVDR